MSSDLDIAQPEWINSLKCRLFFGGFGGWRSAAEGATNNSMIWLTEGGKGTAGVMVQFQLRPHLLAN